MRARRARWCAFEVDADDADVNAYEPIWLDGAVAGFLYLGRLFALSRGKSDRARFRSHGTRRRRAGGRDRDSRQRMRQGAPNHRHRCLTQTERTHARVSHRLPTGPRNFEILVGQNTVPNRFEKRLSTACFFRSGLLAANHATLAHMEPASDTRHRHPYACRRRSPARMRRARQAVGRGRCAPAAALNHGEVPRTSQQGALVFVDASPAMEHERTSLIASRNGRGHRRRFRTGHPKAWPRRSDAEHTTAMPAGSMAKR